MSDNKGVIVQGQQQQKGVAQVDILRSDLTKMMPQFKMALPENVTPEKFLRVVLNTVMSNPDFLKCDRQSLYAACMKCAADGLFPDNREAAMIPYGDTVQYQTMIAGVYKKVRNSGEISLLCADLVYPGDSFRYGSNSDKGRYLDHQPSLDTRGNVKTVIAAFALSRTTDGDVDFEVMTREEIEFTRSTSKAKNSPAWANWWGEMAKKTVVKRLAKRLPMFAEARKILDRDDEDYDVQLKPLSKAEELRNKLLAASGEKGMPIEAESAPVPPAEGDFAAFGNGPVAQQEDPRLVK